MDSKLWQLFEETCGKECANAYTTFFKGMVNRMIVSSYKYGMVHPAIWDQRDFFKNIELRLEKTRETRNTEFLMDVANFCAMFYCYPTKGYSFEATDSDQSPGIVGRQGTIMSDKDHQQNVQFGKDRQALRNRG